VSDPGLEAAAARLEEIAPGYLDRIRKATAGMSVPRTPPERARRAIDLVVATAQINPNAPLLSRRRSGRFIKRVIGSLVRFYVVFVAGQITDLGESASWMGTALCDYVEGLETEVAMLSERVRRLEEAQGRS
jgi:hypothetical protein